MSKRDHEKIPRPATNVDYTQNREAEFASPSVVVASSLVEDHVSGR